MKAKERKIKRIVFNWSEENSMCPPNYTVGEDGVIEIKEGSYFPAEYCVTYFYEIFFENGSMQRIFNPNHIYFSEEQQ